MYCFFFFHNDCNYHILQQQYMYFSTDIFFWASVNWQWICQAELITPRAGRHFVYMCLAKRHIRREGEQKNRDRFRLKESDLIKRKKTVYLLLVVSYWEMLFSSLLRFLYLALILGQTNCFWENYSLKINNTTLIWGPVRNHDLQPL